jgi:2-polyprenyl-3-methyl-5-hydroxy-6-metoxy-1,4-benzoquinol methylase
MTQPTTIDMTFDTSLVDLHPSPAANANISFSTTDSDPTSDFTPLHQQPSSTNKSSKPVHHIPTQLAYDQWASVYDTDGNMLQAIDDVELSTLLPTFLSSVTSTSLTNPPNELRILDLGCGTGRNTQKLLSYAYPAETLVQITGLDFSEKMLNKARSKPVSPSSSIELRLECCDPFQSVPTTSPSSSSTTSPLHPVRNLEKQHAVISTLVLEHIPLCSFFLTMRSLLEPYGQALVTNMHADMGRCSSAGFYNAQGEKVRGSSYVYTVEETIDAAEEAGFKVVSVIEREMRRDDVESGAVGERGWKWVGVKVWYALVLRKQG